MPLIPLIGLCPIWWLWIVLGKTETEFSGLHAYKCRQQTNTFIMVHADWSSCRFILHWKGHAKDKHVFVYNIITEELCSSLMDNGWNMKITKIRNVKFVRTNVAEGYLKFRHHISRATFYADIIYNLHKMHWDKTCTSRKHGKKEPQPFSHCGSFDHHDLQSLNNCIFVFFGFMSAILKLWGM